MTGRARRRLPLDDLVADDLRATEPDQLFAAREAARRHVGDEPGPRIAQALGALLVRRHFDDAARDGLGALGLRGQEQVADDAGFGDERRLDHLHPRLPLDGREILSGLQHLLVRHRAGQIDHRIGVRLSRIRASA